MKMIGPSGIAALMTSILKSAHYQALRKDIRGNAFSLIEVSHMQEIMQRHDMMAAQSKVLHYLRACSQRLSRESGKDREI